ncbi:prepilin-type N-terminal cleavage/methylation domain-containing protein [Chitinimonas arctica]|uniref:Prepilin-type N-terminal cleavage/methylation domain-containing protein n=1 Tax=Chitinimonas arctica TaxID=2594795 RepID=A0A516SL13_9NEIS|nr:prepilin-type N-terminal cleavage/methylation domain-containing protein [Chitinimonas arctica]QDQ28708.1 prepilin-type N-terminal cleavage/methylation domain-containing protein [Chitinimonas arctica]
MQRGFTLIEIAIVLVIVGLLLGGILRGQTVVGGAQAKDIIKSVLDTQAAALTFKDRYGFLPGDLPNPANSIPGIAGCNAGTGTGTLNTAAKRNCARDELILSNLLRGTAGTPIQVQNVTISLSNAAGAGFALPANWVNVVVIARLNCDTALQLDRGLDDGNTGTGNLRASVACAGQDPAVAVPLAAIRLN